MLLSGCRELKALTFPTHNSLLDLLLKDLPEARGLALEKVSLQPGDLLLEGNVYFPQDALLTLVQVHPRHQAVDVAVVGRHACVGPADLWASPMQATVIVSGHAYRLAWSQVQGDPALYSPWLWHTTAATHGLIQQMAQMAFCVRHHNATQRLASWLLMCQAQFGGTALGLSLDCLPSSIRHTEDALQNALSTLQSQGAIALVDARLKLLDAARLAGVACRCHTMVTHASAERPLRPL